MSERPGVRLDSEMAARLRATAKERGVSTSDVIRSALELFFGVEPVEADDERVLEVLAQRAARGSVPAARELLRHRRWQQDSRRRDDGGDDYAQDDGFAALDAHDTNGSGFGKRSGGSL